MKNIEERFKAESKVKAEDRKHRKTINHNIGKYNDTVVKGKMQFADLHTARERAKNLKWRAIESLDKHLESFEKLISARGVKVIWAETAEQALQEIGKICEEKQCKLLVKSKSMVTEEIHLNDFLENRNIESIETDLGEYIQQLAKEPPYHIVTPAMHKSKDEIAELFSQKLGTSPNLDHSQLTLVAREILREKFSKAEVGITGANFIIADVGGIAITENEGNARLSCSMPKTHIVVAGIEKMIPSITDLALFWPLLATFGTGQQVTSYNTIITGPKLPGEVDGPEEMFIILLDNGRTKILADPIQRESLYCIRCGACLNVCPVYKNIGGHTYNTTYSGPIGAVITPNLKTKEEWKHLSQASSLCGNCTEVCAVKINLHELLLENRNSAYQKGAGFTEKMAWKIWKVAMLNRKWLNIANGKMKTKMLNLIGKEWVNSRSPLEFPEQSFNQQWVKQFEKK